MQIQQDNQAEEKVPVFSKWKYWYWLVIGFLGLLILLFYFFTKRFS
jgi:Mg2+ and Co2+ transporter CorA